MQQSDSYGSESTSNKQSCERAADEANGFTVQHRYSKNPFEGRKTHFTDDLWTYVSILTYIADVVSDLLVCIKYYKEKNLWWFSLTLGFLLFASFGMQLFSAKWLLEDGKRPNCFTYVWHVLHLGPVLRYWSVLKSGWRARQRDTHLIEFATFLGEWRDISMLRLFQAFLQSAPQLVLQLYILIQRGRFELKTDLLTAVAAGCSLISMIWAILAYSKSLRDFRRQGYTLSGTGLFFQILWRVSMVTSRVVAMVLFASYFNKWLFVAVGAHWFVMTLWLICQRTRFCTDEDGSEHPFREKLFSAVIGFMYIFCFFNTREGTTRKRVVLYYSIILVENSLFVSMWYPHRSIQGVLALVALGVVWGGFGFGVLCMALYYRFYHPSLPVQGIFLQKRTFDLEGQSAYSLVCCCCCQVRGAAIENSLNQQNGMEGLLRNAGSSMFKPGYPPLEAEIFPRTSSRELSPDNASDNQLRCTRSRDWIPGSPANILVHSTPLGVHGLNTRHPLVASEVPEIVVTGATPEVTSPQDSISNSSLVTLTKFDLQYEDDVHPLPEHDATEATCDNMNDRMDGSITVHSQSTEPLGQDGKLSREQDCYRVPTNAHDNTEDSGTKSPTAGEIISWFHPAKTGESALEEEDDERTPINYGSLSFGHRYSLVSSDCISLSSESSRSSLDSIVFADEGPGVSGTNDKETRSIEMAPKTADEGIFSDERDSPGKIGLCVPEDPDRDSEPSQPQKPRVNAQFAVLQEKRKQSESSELTGQSPILSSPNEDNIDIVELMMDATSPRSSLRRKEKEKAISSPGLSEKKVSGEKGVELKLLSELERKEKHPLTQGLVSDWEDGHESESTDASSDSFRRGPRHRSYDGVEVGFIDVQTSPDDIDCAVNKRHTFDFSQLSKGGSSSGRKRGKRQRRSKKREFDNFVITSLRPGKYSSLRRSIERLAKIQEDTEETFLLNTESALNAVSPENEPNPSLTQDLESDEVQHKNALIPNLNHDSEAENYNTHSTDPEMEDVGTARGNFIRRRKLKRFYTKELAPGKFSSVRFSDEISTDDDFQSVPKGNGTDLKNRCLPSSTSVDSFLPNRRICEKNCYFDGDARRKTFVAKTVSLPDVIDSTRTKLSQDMNCVNHYKGAEDDKSQGSSGGDDGLNSNHPGNTVEFNASALAPMKRHSYDSNTNCKEHLEMREIRLGKANESSLKELTGDNKWDGKRTAVDHLQRGPHSEVVISRMNSAVYV